MAVAARKLTRRRALAAGLAALGLAAVGVLALPRAPAEEGPVAAFRRPQLDPARPDFSPAQMRGEVWVLNVWASWCPGCREEHPRMHALARDHGVKLVGLDTRDEARAATAWLRQLGDPFSIVALDADGGAARALGVRGLPETLVIDREGIVRLRHRGAVSRAVLEERILPAVREWRSR